MALGALPVARDNRCDEMFHGVRRTGLTVIAVLAAAGVTAVVSLLIMSSRSEGQPSLKLLVASPTGSMEEAPTEFTEFATSVLEGQRVYCQQPWSLLLFEAGESARPFTRSALLDIAAKLPGARRFTDMLLRNFAIRGCVEGFLELLERDREYALS